MPHLIQPGASEHATHRSAAGLRDQTDNQPDERGLFSAPLKMLLVRRVAIGDGSLIGRIGFPHSSLP
jgi:hypothetical protein